MDLSIALLLDCNRRWSHPELSTGHGKCVWTHWLHRLIKCSLLWKQKPATESNNTIKCRQPPKVHYSTLLGLGPRFLSLLYCCLYSFLFTVKPSQAYPPRFYQWIDYLKNESVSRSRNWCQIQSGISACVMSSEYFTRTSLYLVRLEIFEWIKLLRRHLHQFQENGAGRNFITASRVNSQLITHTRMQRSIWNPQLATDLTFE